MKAPMLAAMAAATVTLAATIALASCSTARTSGVIVEKEVEHGICSGKPRKCKPDTYEFDLRTASGEEVEVKVGRAEYDRYRVGDRYQR